jgi:hypothetical protein
MTNKRYPTTVSPVCPADDSIRKNLIFSMSYWLLRRVWRLNSVSLLISKERFWRLLLRMSSFCIAREETMGVVNRPERLQVMLNPARSENDRQLAVLEAHAEPRISGARITQARIGGRGFEVAKDGSRSKDFGLSTG